MGQYANELRNFIWEEEETYNVASKEDMETIKATLKIIEKIESAQYIKKLEHDIKDIKEEIKGLKNG